MVLEGGSQGPCEVAGAGAEPGSLAWLRGATGEALPSPSGLLPARELCAARRMGRAAFTTWMCCHSHPDISCYLTSALSSPFAASSRRRSSPFKNELCARALPPRCSGTAPAPRHQPCPPGTSLAQHGRCQVLEGWLGTGDGQSRGVTSCFSSGRSQKTTVVGTPNSMGCPRFWQGRKLSSQPRLHLQLQGTEASWGWHCIPSALGPCLPEPEELFGVSLQGKSGGVGTRMLW